MTPDRIAPEVVEIAVRAEMDAENMQFGWGKSYSSLSAEDRAARHESMEAAIREADRERGLKEERKLRMVGAPEEPWVLTSRLVSDWRPVERPS
jgi:hypothetical protein